MTPLIKKISSTLPYDVTQDHVWFDVGFFVGGDVDGKTIQHLPFDKIAIVGEATDNFEYCFLLSRFKDYTAVIGAKFTEKEYEIARPFVFEVYEKGIRFHGADDEPIEERDVTFPLSVLTRLFNQLDLTSSFYKMTPRKSPTNARRAKKGKGPISVDWHTVTIAPKVKTEGHIGGTHASPRKHQRRGHWRTIGEDKKVWVRDCWVGDAAKGLVLKDYDCRGSDDLEA